MCCDPYLLKAPEPAVPRILTGVAAFDDEDDTAAAEEQFTKELMAQYRQANNDVGGESTTL